VSGKIDDFNDAQFEQLFASFDEVVASDELKQATLQNILEAAEPEAAEAEAEASAESVTDASVDGAPDNVLPFRPRVKRKGNRLARVAVAVACALAVSGGGVAYALPASQVEIFEGASRIVLDVNIFGMVVGASADDDDAQAVLDEVQVMHRSYEDSSADIVQKYEERAEAEEQGEVKVVASDERQQQALDQKMHSQEGDDAAGEGTSPETGEGQHDDGAVGAGGKKDEGSASSGGDAQDDSGKKSQPAEQDPSQQGSGATTPKAGEPNPAGNGVPPAK